MVDLFTADLCALSSIDVYACVFAFTQMSSPQDQRTTEGYTVDFKEQWTDKALRVVAAFANTLGGVLIVGVREEGGRAKELVGEVCTSELKTRLAGSIAANITPTPLYEIAECELPNFPDRRLAIIRVRTTSKIHYLTRGDHPVYVRNEDQAIPARAPELRNLILRERESAATDALQLLDQSLILQRLPITKRRPTAQCGSPDQRVLAESILRVWITTEYPNHVALDYQVETAFRNLIHRTFPPDSFLHDSTWTTATTITRDKGSVRLDHCHVQRDIESKWLFTQDTAFGYGTRLALEVPDGPPEWSLSDLTAELLASVRAAHAMFTNVGYLAGASVYVSLAQARAALVVERGALPFRRHGKDRSFFAAAPTWHEIAPDAQTHETDGGGAAWLSTTFHTRTATLATSVADLLNQLLRDMGYGADRAQLINYVTAIDC